MAIDAALEDAVSAFDVDKLEAARQVLTETEVPVLGTSTRRRAQRRAFAKWCPKCERAKPRGAFNRNRRKKDGLQDVCRLCQKTLYQEHVGALAGRKDLREPGDDVAI